MAEGEHIRVRATLETAAFRKQLKGMLNTIVTEGTKATVEATRRAEDIAQRTGTKATTRIPIEHRFRDPKTGLFLPKVPVAEAISTIDPEKRRRAAEQLAKKQQQDADRLAKKQQREQRWIEQAEVRHPLSDIRQLAGRYGVEAVKQDLSVLKAERDVRKREEREHTQAANKQRQVDLESQNRAALYDAERIKRSRKIIEHQQKYGKEAVRTAYLANRYDWEGFQFAMRRIGVQRREAEMQRREAISRQKQAGGRVSGGLLAAGGLGIGLLGQAGFPMLNVGFASMSAASQLGLGAAGTAGAAGIVGLATAAGESTRALMRLQDEAIASAQSLNFMSRGFKDTTAQTEAVKAFFGGITEIAQERRMKERTEFMKKPGAIVSDIYLAEFRTAWRNILINPSGIFHIMERTQESLAKMPERIESMKQSYLEKGTPFTAKWEKPEAVWSRIQAAAAGGQPNEQKLVEIQMKTYEEFGKYIRKAIENEKEKEKIRQSLREMEMSIPGAYLGVYN